jgi:hypothetical protein
MDHPPRSLLCPATKQRCMEIPCTVFSCAKRQRQALLARRVQFEYEERRREAAPPPEDRPIA